QGSSGTEHEQVGHGLARARDANRGYRERTPRHTGGHGATLCQILQQQPDFLDESPNTLRPGSCRGRDRREGCARRPTVSRNSRLKTNEGPGLGRLSTADFFQKSRGWRRGTSRPKYSYALCVATRPRGVRSIMPICIRYGSYISSIASSSSESAAASVPRPTGPPAYLSSSAIIKLRSTSSSPRASTPSICKASWAT